MLHLAWRSLSLQAYKLNNLILHWFNILVEKIDFLRNCLTNDISYHVYMSKHLQDNLFHCWLKIYNDAIWLRKYPVGFTSLYLKFVFFCPQALPPHGINFVPLKQEESFRADKLMEFYKVSTYIGVFIVPLYTKYCHVSSMPTIKFQSLMVIS